MNTMKDTFYFSHDYNTRSDAKIRNLIRKHGMKGYGIYWAIVEDLYNNANALRTDYNGIAYDLHTTSEIIKSIINDFELFTIDNGSFSSESISRRLMDREEKSVKARESANKRWSQYDVDANALRTHSEGNAIKERKGKEKKENVFIPLSAIKKIWIDQNKQIEFDYIAKFFPKLIRLKEPLMPGEHDNLVERYGKEDVAKLYGKMQNNRNLLRNNESAYLTAISWIDHDTK